MSEETEIEKPKKSRKKINWTTDKIMSTSALFISVISLIALLYQSYLAREENKLIQMQQSASVLPHLNQWYSNYNNTFKFVVGNKGVGPAFIDEVEIALDSEHKFNNTKDLFDYIFKNNKVLDTIPYTYSTLVEGFVLPANEQIDILEIKNAKHIQPIRDALNNENIIYKIVYKDVYGSKWVLTNDNTNGTSTNIPITSEK
ncbi:hypothetical protein [Winogradskyella poriferorum]|uniref:Uncharacterized protein n=1 Tax=Winogradskyella poriferorum TaxID=307627 RepID=A0ABU7W5L2_9FLAO|tara:strand:- start:5631 stop:6233 length:603 start_codon:yes stop_codon:yes gene_type:complete